MLDVKRTGYDNLWLVVGHDWQAKMVAAGVADWHAEVKRLTENFSKIDKKDVVEVAKWENEVLHACGMHGKPLPTVKQPAKVSKHDAPKPVEAVKLPAVEEIKAEEAPKTE